MERSKSTKKRMIIAVIIFGILAAAVIFWFLPMRILSGYKPEEITRIDVEGIPGGTVTLNEEETRYIAENLYECGAKRSGISFGRMGYGFQLVLYKGDQCVSVFSVNTDDSGRDPIFFYEPEQGSYCMEYLNTLAFKYAK